MEKDNNQRVADQREVIRDLQQKLSQSQDENEKKSLQLKINVAQAKLEELENKQANDISTNSPVNEGTPQNTKQFHNAITDGEYSDKLDESIKLNQIVSSREKEINTIKKDLDAILKFIKNKYWDNAIESCDIVKHRIYNLETEIKEDKSEYKDGMIVESMPQGYSESKFLKELEQSCKYFEDEVKNIRKAAKDKRYDLIAAYFARTANFAKMLSDNTEDIVSQQKKGVLTESQDEDYIIKQVCLYAKPQMFKSKGVTPAMLATAIGDYIVTTPNSSDIFNVNHFAKILDGIIASRKENPNKHILQKVEKNCSKLFEGCMTRKFENMTNKEVASYIFSHPHTKFASKMKECDDKEIMKAIRDMKKASEDAPVTNTSAIASAPRPSMYLKRPKDEELKDDYLKESVDSEIDEILDDVEEMYGQGAKRLLRDEIYHNNYLVTRDSFIQYVRKLSGKGNLSDFIEAILDKDTRTFDNIVKKLK